MTQKQKGVHFAVIVSYQKRNSKNEAIRHRHGSPHASVTSGTSNPSAIAMENRSGSIRSAGLTSPHAKYLSICNCAMELTRIYKHAGMV